MAAQPQHTRRILRWVLTGLLALAVVWAIPSATASAQAGGWAGGPPQLLKTAVPSASGAVLVAPRASGPAHQQSRIADAACPAVAAVPGEAYTRGSTPTCHQVVSRAHPYSPGPRAPPFEGLD